jgi:hypothetical protein
MRSRPAASRSQSKADAVAGGEHRRDAGFLQHAHVTEDVAVIVAADEAAFRLAASGLGHRVRAN